MSTPETIKTIERAIEAAGGSARVREIFNSTGMNITTIKRCLNNHPARFEKAIRNQRVVFWRRKGK